MDSKTGRYEAVAGYRMLRSIYCSIEALSLSSKVQLAMEPFLAPNSVYIRCTSPRKRSSIASATKSANDRNPLSPSLIKGTSVHLICPFCRKYSCNRAGKVTRTCCRSCIWAFSCRHMVPIARSFTSIFIVVWVGYDCPYTTRILPVYYFI